METVLDLGHFLLVVRSEPRLGGGPAEHQRHPGAGVDLDPHGAGHTVAAATAEVAGELLAVLLNDGLELIGQNGDLPDARQELVQLPVVLHAPDGDHTGLEGQEGRCRGAAADQSAGHALHGDEAHTGLGAQVHQLLLLGSCQIAVRELERGIEAGFNGLVSNGQTVVADADVADLALTLGLHSRIVKAVRSAGLGAEGGIVELIDIDVIGVQHFETGLQVLPHLLGVGSGGLGGDDHLAAHSREGSPYLCLAVGVGPGGVIKRHAAVKGTVQQPHGLFLTDALNGETAKAIFFNDNAGGTQRDVCHNPSSFVSIPAPDARLEKERTAPLSSPAFLYHPALAV